MVGKEGERIDEVKSFVGDWLFDRFDGVFPWLADGFWDVDFDLGGTLAMS